MEKSTWYLKILILILFVSPPFLIFTLLFLNQIETDPKHTEAKSVSASAARLETDSWETYLNSVDRYSFKYPQNWSINAVEKNRVIVTNPISGKGLLIATGMSEEFTQLEEWLNFRKNTVQTQDKFISSKKLVLSDEDAYLLEFKDVNQNSFFTVISIHNKVQILLVYTESSLSTLEQIIDNFKFNN